MCMADKKELPLAMIEILIRYTDENHSLSTNELRDILEQEYNLTLERRTLYANMELLKKYGYDISTWQENGLGYYLRSHQFSKSEVFLLCNAIHSSHFISQKESSQLIKKLLSTLSMYERKDYTDKVYLPNPKKTRNERLLTNLSLISDAIRDRNPIEFGYLRHNINKTLTSPRTYEVQPRYIVYQDSKAYLIVTSDHHEGFAHYRMDRISDIRILKDKRFAPLPKEMDAYEYSRNMFYMFNDEAVHAVLRCERRVLDHMIDTFGEEAMILPADDDRFDIHVKGSRQGILLFAQQYIDAAVILEPAELRSEMLDRLETAASYYNGK